MKINKSIIKLSYRIKRVNPENYDLQDHVHFKGDLENTIGEIHLARIKNAKVVQYFLFSRLKLLKHYCLVPQLLKGFYWKPAVKNILFPTKRIDNGIWVIDNWSKGYFHWITDVLPRLITCERASVVSPVLFPEHFLKVGFIRESLEIFGCQYISYPLDKSIKVKELYAPSHLCPCGGDPEQLQAVRLKFRIKDKFDYKGYKKIYISRSKAARRTIVNEDKLINLLYRYNIEVVYMEELDFFQQRKLMSETNIIISNHGAGLTNMIFMPDNSKVIELKADANNINNCFFNLARGLDHEYYYTINKGNNSDVQRSDISVDLEKLENILNNFS